MNEAIADVERKQILEEMNEAGIRGIPESPKEEWLMEELIKARYKTIIQQNTIDELSLNL